MTETKSHPLHIYTDGSSRGNPGPGGFGIVLLWGEKRKEISQGFRLTTNNRMELMAVIVALQSLSRKNIPLTVYTDSQYVVNSVEKKWLDNRPVFDEIFSASKNSLKRLDDYCSFAYQKQKEMADKLGKVLGCPYVTCGSELSTLDERVRHKMDEIFTSSSKYFETLLRDAKAENLTSVTNPATAAQEMLSYIAGVMYQAKLKNDVEIINRDLKSGLLRYFDITKNEDVEKLDYRVKSVIYAGTE